MWTCYKSRRDSVAQLLKEESFWIGIVVQQSFAIQTLLQQKTCYSTQPHMSLATPQQSWMRLVPVLITGHEQGIWYNMDISLWYAHTEEGYKIVLKTPVLCLFNFYFLLDWGYLDGYSYSLTNNFTLPVFNNAAHQWKVWGSCWSSQSSKKEVCVIWRCDITDQEYSILKTSFNRWSFLLLLQKWNSKAVGTQDFLYIHLKVTELMWKQEDNRQ